MQRVFFWGEGEHVAGWRAAIRIEAGQRRALRVEAALPLLRKSTKKPLDQQLMLGGACENGIPLESRSAVLAATHAAAGC